MGNTLKSRSVPNLLFLKNMVVCNLKKIYISALSFSHIGITLAILNWSGKTQVEKEQLKTMVSDSDISGATLFTPDF